MKKRVLVFLLTIIIAFSTIPSFSVALAETKKNYKVRTTSDLGVGFIEAFEGYNQYAYWDYSQYTIGYGTRCEKDEYPAGISEPFAHALLKKVLPTYEAGLNSFLKKNNIYVTQNQYDALVSFTYNFGAYVWDRDPTIAKYLKNGIENYTDKQIADAFGLWVNAGGVPLPGLVERRKAEATLFCTDDFSFADEMYVITDSVNLRSGAGTSYSYVASLKRGDVLKVTEKKYIGTRAWGKTTYNGKNCWFALEYAKYGNDHTTASSLIATCLYKAESVVEGIKLYWKQVPGATGYKIYKRDEDSAAYLLVKTTTKNTTVSYTDKDVSEKQYKYYIVAYNEKKNASKSGVCTITYRKAPKLRALKKSADGYTLTWYKQSDATGYQVLRRNDGDATFVKLASVGADTLSYTDKTAVGGVKYFYTVKSYTSKALSGAPSAKSGIFLATASVTSSKNTKTAITVNWNRVTGATGYYVYRKAPGESEFKLVSTIKNGSTVSYKDSNVAKSKTYNYAVKAYSGSVESDMSAAFATKIFTPPTITSAESTSTGVKISWKKVSGINVYNVYRKLSTESEYKLLAKATGTSYTDTTADGGKKYYYKVASYKYSCKESYLSSAKACSFVKAVAISLATSVKTGLKLSWQKQSGAKSYSVYKYASGKYTLLSTVTGASYIDTTLAKNKKRVYAIKTNYESVSSDYSSHFQAYNLATPTLTVKSVSNGLLLSWNEVKNATGLIIYRKDPGETSFKLYTKQDNYGKYTFENSTAVKGKTYSYKIKVIRGNNTSMVSNTVKIKRK